MSTNLMYQILLIVGILASSFGAFYFLCLIYCSFRARRLEKKTNSKIIKVLYHDAAHGEKIKAAHSGEWIDVRAQEDVHFEKGEFKLVELGISVKLPDNYEAILAPRSSTFKNYGLIMTNSIGVIDNSYSGNDDIWKAPFYATKSVTIQAGDRIAQFRIQPTQGNITIVEVADLGNENRGGFGSTGTK